MQQYARKGVATQCFDREAFGLLQYLPWAQRISPLAEETSDRSQDFWESLQSDILGESIVIYGEADQTVLLPEGSTALDGAFYCLSEKALWLESVKINGEEVSFQALLENGSSLETSVSARLQVQREWLQWARTGVALTAMHAGLARRPKQKKIAEGRRLLEEVMEEKHKGLLVEFEEKGFLPHLRLLGFSSLDDATIAIAEGRTEPAEVFRTLFESQRKVAAASADQKKFILRFTMQRDDIETLRRLVDVYQKFNINLSNIRIWGLPLSEMRRFTVKAMLSQEECEMLKEEIEHAGGEQVEIAPHLARFRYAFGVGLLLFLWGIDPVFARLLVTEYGVAPVDLTLIRFWTLTLLCGALLASKLIRGELRHEAVIPLKSRWLWLSAGLLVIIAWSSYASLQLTLASHYTILMTATGLVLTSMQNAKRWRILLVTWIFYAAGGLLLLRDPSWSIEGIVLTAIAVCSFTLFSFVSEKYKRKEHVAARALQYFFALSFFSLLLSFPLIGVNTIATLSPRLIIASVLFCIFISALPYYLYYYMLSQRQFDFVLRYSFLIIIASVGGQAMILGQINRLIVAAGLLVILGALFPLIATHLSKQE